MNLSGNKKVALVHDFLIQYGGAERVLETLAEMFPKAPIYTLLYDRGRMREHFSGRDIRTSSLDRLPQWIKRHHRWLLPLYATAVETFDLRDFDVVISSSGAWSKGVITRSKTTHIAYVHSPMRYVWEGSEGYLDRVDARGRFRFCKRLLLSYLRLWDREAADRPDVLLANSHFTEERMLKYYRRESMVVYPGAMELWERYGTSVEGMEFKRKHFLIVARLNESKNIDIAIETANKMSIPLSIVGDGNERKHLKAMAGPTVTFTGRLSDKKLAEMYARARAVIIPSEEDFGIAAVEALAFGTPVIALGSGGVCEIVTNGVTGEFFAAPTPEVLADGVRRFLEKEGQYDRVACHAVATRFSTKVFQKAFSESVDQCFPEGTLCGK